MGTFEAYSRSIHWNMSAVGKMSAAVVVAVLLVLCGAVGQLDAKPADAATPVVMWHGMGDSCCNPLSMGSIKRLIEEQVGNNVAEDTENGFLMNANKQVDMVCDMIQKDSKL